MGNIEKKHNNRRYTVEDVRIVAEYYSRFSADDLASILGLSKQTIYRIANMLRKYIDLPYCINVRNNRSIDMQ